MRAFVTGATGFIGRHLCERLVQDGHDVVAMVRTPEKAAVLPESVEVFRGDLSTFASPETVLPQADVVIHLAGVVTATDPATYREINYVAVEDLVRCIERQEWSPRRLLFASSLAAAGPSPEDRAWTEADPLAPVEPYGAAKAEAEAFLRDVTFPTTAFRPPIVFGPGDDASLTLFKAAHRGVGMMVGSTPQRLSFVDVRDLADALVLMAHDDRASFQVYFASHPESTDTRELWTELGHAVGRRVRVARLPRAVLYGAMRLATAGSAVFGFSNQLDDKQYRQMVARAFVCSSEALRRDLGWAPRFSLGDALAHAAEGYRAAGRLD